MDTFRILRAEEADIPGIVRLVNLAYRGGEDAGWTSEGAYLDGERTNALSIAALLRQAVAVLLKCVDEEGRLAGCVFLEEEEGQLHLGTFAVEPGIQAQGLGRKMLAYANNYAKQRGYDRIIITVVNARTELIDWYVRRGFERTGKLIPFPAHWGTPRFDVHFVEMQRMVD